MSFWASIYTAILPYLGVRNPPLNFFWTGSCIVHSTMNTINLIQKQNICGHVYMNFCSCFGVKLPAKFVKAFLIYSMYLKCFYKVLASNPLIVFDLA